MTGANSLSRPASSLRRGRVTAHGIGTTAQAFQWEYANHDD
jgi:hypothetical protein